MTTKRAGRAGVLGALGFAAALADDALVGTVRDVHGAVAGRVHRTIDAAIGVRTPAHAAHLAIAGGVFTGIDKGLQATSRSLAAADRAGVGGRLEEGPRGRFVVSALNGIFGDRIHERHPELAITMAVRLEGRDVALDRSHLSEAFPDATPDLVVFVHGLSESEHYWDRRGDQTGGSYGDRLRREAGWTPIFLRINSGLSLSENGIAMAALMDELVAAWPTGVRRVALVGHSMGGLIARAACAVVSDADTHWNELVSDVVTLGTPHLGAPIARALTAGSKGLSLLPESAPFGRFLDHRAVSILDLRNGLPRDVQHLPRARYHLVAATLTQSHRHPVAEIAGDMLVRYPSAIGRPRRGPEMFPGADVLHVPGAGHFDLLNHDDVYAAIRAWLSAPRPDLPRPDLSREETT